MFPTVSKSVVSGHATGEVRRLSSQLLESREFTRNEWAALSFTSVVQATPDVGFCMTGVLLLQAAPGASPTGGAAQLHSRKPGHTLEGAGARSVGLPEGVAEDEGAAGSLIFRCGRPCSLLCLIQVTTV